MSECTNELMEKAESQTDMFQICLTCKDNLTCPVLNEEEGFDNGKSST